MTHTGLNKFCSSFPTELVGKRLGIVCHAASVAPDYSHIIDLFAQRKDCSIGAIFGPQHGLFGQTQDNMIEWEGTIHPTYKVPVYSLYGKVRKPTSTMLSQVDALIFDIQDVGARPYTYVWTLKNCMEACQEYGIPIWVLDRPNPIGLLPWDGPLLQQEYFSFVGGMQIPLCHRMTMGEMGLMLKQTFFPKVEMHVVWMENWKRNSLWSHTDNPWILPSPNMPTLDTAIVYPGMVLLEATNLSEGRGTTRPFELFGAPYLHRDKFIAALNAFNLPGCHFRYHGFIPTFQKWHGEYCEGFQIHVTDVNKYKPVLTTMAILLAAIQYSDGKFQFKNPPYEYETLKMPFDILMGNEDVRKLLLSECNLNKLEETWDSERTSFIDIFKEIAHYPED